MPPGVRQDGPTRCARGARRQDAARGRGAARSRQARREKYLVLPMRIGCETARVEPDAPSARFVEEESLMDATRFEALLRSVVAGRSRRGLLAGLSGGLLVALPGALGRQETAARKKKRKRRGGTPSTCAELCPENAPFCVAHVGNPPFCASNVSVSGCTGCALDQDCLGVGDRPYCVTADTTRATGDSFNVTGPGSVCQPLTTAGACARVYPP